jgi:hypothetical protein
VGDRTGGRANVRRTTSSRCAEPGVEHERWGTPVASYVAGLTPDARPLDRGKPLDEDTEGGSQPADKSLINRRLSLRSQLCATHGFSAERVLNHASPLDRECQAIEIIERIADLTSVRPGAFR